MSKSSITSESGASGELASRAPRQLAPQRALIAKAGEVVEDRLGLERLDTAPVPGQPLEEDATVIANAFACLFLHHPTGSIGATADPSIRTSVQRQGRVSRHVGVDRMFALMRYSAIVVVAGLSGAVIARGSDHPANVHWERFLPALPSPSEIQPRSVPNCRRATIRCIDVEIRRLRELQRRWGCDHRAVFATTYLELTRTLRRVLRERPQFLRYPKYLYVEDALFANVYFNAIRDARRRRRVPEAWRIAFEAAQLSRSQCGAGHAARHQRARSERHAVRARRARPADPFRRLAQGGPRRDQRGARPLVSGRRPGGARPVRPAGRPDQQRVHARRRRPRPRAREGVARAGVAQRRAASECARRRGAAAGREADPGQRGELGAWPSPQSSRTATGRVRNSYCRDKLG